MKKLIEICDVLPWGCCYPSSQQVNVEIKGVESVCTPGADITYQDIVEKSTLISRDFTSRFSLSTYWDLTSRFCPPIGISLQGLVCPPIGISLQGLVCPPIGISL
ncbi:hypothetical protein Btru_068998 [Bulinus truncatus]|nr:hypothetical protein Btru_068998 [Bulinus truncatus]